MADYALTFPFGATSSPYSPASPHRGDDYGYPEGAPLIVGGQMIGRTGHTGAAIGPHVHVQEWSGDVANVRKPQHPFEGGVVNRLSNDPNQGSWGKYITIRNADGWNTTYAHLSEIDVSVGQVIGDEMTIVDQNILDLLVAAICNGRPIESDKSLLGVDMVKATTILYNDARHKALIAKADSADKGFNKVGQINNVDIYEKG